MATCVPSPRVNPTRPGVSDRRGARDDAGVQDSDFDIDHPKVGSGRPKASLERGKSRREATGFCS